jgi:hypothetical protein
MLDFETFFKQTNKSSACQTLSKTPELFFERHGYIDMKFLIGKDYKETQYNIYCHVYGRASCVMCNQEHPRWVSWQRGWSKTCSSECEGKLHSERQQGEKNTSHRMTPETLQNMKEKMSVIMKNKILKGEFTPKNSNYARQRPIKYLKEGIVTSVRSLWELIFALQNPHLEHETIRIKYFDTVKNKERIYITDFFDKENNTIYEIRPKCYQSLLVDKKIAVLNKGYNFVVLDEDYFNLQKTTAMITMIENVVCDINDVRNRLKWLRKV